MAPATSVAPLDISVPVPLPCLNLVTPTITTIGDHAAWEIRAEGHNIVLLGGWNRNIFTPQWVASSLGHVDEVGFQLAVDDPNLPFRISFRDYVLTVRSDRLQLYSTIVSDESLHGTRDLAVRLLEMLPHTPISALGVNFAWRELDPPRSLLPLFTLDDTIPLADAGKIATDTAIKRSFPWKESVLNLTIALSAAGHVRVEFNFHWAVAGAVDATQHLNQCVSDAGETARTLLRTVYDLEEDL